MHIFITGASSGIGLAIVEELTSHNYTLHLTVRNESDQKRLESLSPRIFTYLVDVTNHASIVKCGETTE
ncbi:MAG: SDR family NAD(P)-dependent oxidoreductase [Calditrichaeota bacterium]|nr:SDR family NAD(P)-dependent oxidoreductase [Calditrichota bacterium]